MIGLCGDIFAAHFGGIGGAYLRAPVGATGLGMGGAMSASPQYLPVWWNPAALADLKKRSVSIGAGYRPMGRTDGLINFEFPIPTRMALGISVLYRGDSHIAGLVDINEEPLSDMSYTTITGKIGASYRISRKLAAGITVALFYQSLPSAYDEDKNPVYSSNMTIGGFDIGVRYLLNKKLTYGLVLKNILALNSWQYTGSGLNVLAYDTLPVTVTLGQSLSTTFLGKPFIWNSDIVGYVFNGYFRPLDHSHAVFNNGFEWQRFNALALRIGVRDIEVNRDLVVKSDEYFDYFSLAFSLGFMLDLSSALKGKKVKFNYALSNSKAGVGIDQQLDFVWQF
jgi:hypothetical protein